MNRYELKEELGDGSFGLVMKALHKETGEVVAIKQIKRKFKSWKACVDLREVQSLRNMAHANIVPIIEVIRERDNSLYFIFEYMPGGSLYQLMKSCVEDRKAGKPGRLKDDRIRSFVQQILLGLQYIHGEGYVHRDIKPENILVNGSTCKVADFGLARQEPRGGNKITYYVSTRWYRAPEVILHCPSYGKPIDIFATGLILAELYSLRPLFPGTSEIDQVNKMMSLLGPPTAWNEGVSRMKRMNISSSSFQLAETKQIEAIHKNLPKITPLVVPCLVRIMIQWNPAMRPTVSETLDHEYFQCLDKPVNASKENLAKRDPKKPLWLNQTQQQGCPENKLNTIPTKLCGVGSNPQKVQHGHRTIEVVEEKRKPGTGKGDQQASEGKALPSLSKLSQPNEFTQYLRALSSMDGQPCGNKPPRNEIRSVLPENRQHSRDPMPNPFQSLDLDGGRGKPQNKIRPMLPEENSQYNTESRTNPYQCLDMPQPIHMPTPGGRRTRIARAVGSKHISIGDIKSSRKSRRKPKSDGRFRHGGHASEKPRPRWLLSNQNMGRRAMEVCVSRPTQNATDDICFSGLDAPTPKRVSRDEDPFTCLDA